MDGATFIVIIIIIISDTLAAAPTGSHLTIWASD
jgi:hypothetical protein